MESLLVLEDGSVFEGKAYGARGLAFGEVVFNTSMTGYQEILTDPSYKGQIVTMTYPLIGNYGVNAADVESNAPQCSGFLVREASNIYSNFRSNGDLDSYLKKNNIIALSEIDTRALTRHLRDKGAMRGVISSTGGDVDSLLKKVKASRSMVGADLAKEVTCKTPYKWTEGLNTQKDDNKNISTNLLKIVAIDFGAKHNILRILKSKGCELTVVPGNSSAEEILKYSPDGVFLSNGPGDPQAVTYGIETVKNLLGKKPIFGICLGHQILSLALGGKTFKLKFGHRGANHPVKNLITGSVEITSQNHGFATDPNSFNNDVEISHLNLNDQTCEGIRHKNIPAFSVQYHPEASPGPHDSTYLFDRFFDLIKKGT